MMQTAAQRVMISLHRGDALVIPLFIVADDATRAKEKPLAA
jgi:hypothetical protein